ncbi:hypothetical protein ACIPL1_17605 [Pseudomonas sp. NPDC090202]|uniref:hypothetical protein n=1 Tax=unclassified Pseudomonas TaxID=196821 RepID=UPI00380EF317
MTQVSNTVRVYAAPGRSEELGKYLVGMVEKLPSLPGVVHSELRHDEKDGSWVLEVLWDSCKSMADHFAQPSNERLNGLLNSQLIRQVAFDSDIDRCNLPGAE